MSVPGLFETASLETSKIDGCEMKRFRRCGPGSDSLRKRVVARAVFFLAIAGLCLALSGFVDMSQAEPVQLASFSGLVPLPDTSMAVITGTGLQSPSFSGNVQPRGAVTLWDEIRPSNLQQRIDDSGIVTLTVNGVTQ
jgi:hypothetical protein